MFWDKKINDKRIGQQDKEPDQLLNASFQSLTDTRCYMRFPVANLKAWSFRAANNSCFFFLMDWSAVKMSGVVVLVYEILEDWESK